MDGSWQQGWKTHAVQRELWQKYQGGVVTERMTFISNIEDLIPQLNHIFTNMLHRSIPMKWRLSRWSRATLGATGVRWRLKTSVTAPPLRFLWRVSENRSCGPSEPTHIPHALMFRSDPALMCLLCNFSCFSRTAGAAEWYFVCLQKSVSVRGPDTQEGSMHMDTV